MTTPERRAKALNSLGSNIAKALKRGSANDQVQEWIKEYEQRLSVFTDEEMDDETVDIHHGRLEEFRDKLNELKDK